MDQSPRWGHGLVLWGCPWRRAFLVTVPGICQSNVKTAVVRLSCQPPALGCLFLIVLQWAERAAENDRVQQVAAATTAFLGGQIIGTGWRPVNYTVRGYSRL